MNSRGTLYNEIPSGSSDAVTWTSTISSRASEPLKKNLFLQSLYEEEQKKAGVTRGINSGKDDLGSEILDKDIVESLENSVQYWTDYSKVHFHPKSLYELHGLWMSPQEFDNYGLGRDAFSEGLRGEDIKERFRFFVEECDHIQGVQFILDDSGGFSGVAAEFLENIADEYTNIPVLLYTVRNPGSYTIPQSRRQTISRSLQDAISFSRLSSFCKLITPIGLPSLTRSKALRYLCVEDEKLYHSSAVYASALHSISLPFRMEPHGSGSRYVSGALDMNGVVQMLAGQARQNMVTILDVAMPAPSLTGKMADQSLIGNMQPLTPETVDVEDLQATESMTIHGAFGAGGHRASISEVTDTVEATYEHTTAKPKFSHLSVASSPLPIPLPFPSIFRNIIGQNGELLATPISDSKSRGSLDVHSIPMAARLRSSVAVLPFLENRLGNLQRLGLDHGALGAEIVRSWGFGRDEIEDIGETLSGMVTTLDPRSQVSSDSD